MGERKLDDAERQERLTAAIESQTNALNRLVQLLEEKQRPRVKAQRVRPKAREVVVSERAERVAKAALARIKAKGGL